MEKEQICCWNLFLQYHSSYLFNALVGITYSARLTCCVCKTRADPVEPILYLSVPKEKEVDIEEAIKKHFQKKKQGEVMPSSCKPKCG